MSKQPPASFLSSSPPPADGESQVHADLLDRLLAGDLSQAEAAQLEQIASADPAFAAALAEARLLDATISGALKGLANRFALPGDSTDLPTATTSVTDMAAVDLYLAGMLSQREVSGLLSDPASEAELVDALRYEALLSESLARIAQTDQALTVTGIELVDRYLAGDLSAEEQAELFAHSSDESAVTPALNEARACEAMLRDSLRRLAGSVPMTDEPELSRDSPTVLDDLIDRSLAGALKQSELEQLAEYAMASESAGRRVAEAEAMLRLIGDALTLAAAGASPRPSPASDRYPQALAISRSSLANSRLRAEAKHRRRVRNTKLALGGSLTLLLAIAAALAILQGDWLTSNQFGSEAGSQQPVSGPSADPSIDPHWTDRTSPDPDPSPSPTVAVDQDAPTDSETVDVEPESPMVILPSAIVHEVEPRDSINLRPARQPELRVPAPTVPASDSDPAEPTVDAPANPDSAAGEDPDTVAALVRLELWPDRSQASARVEASDTLGRNLASLRRNDGLYRLWPEEQPDHTRRGGGRSRVSQDGRVVHAVALQSHCLRAAIVLADGDAAALEEMEPGLESLRKLVREKRDFQLLTIRDASGYLTVMNDWHAALARAGKTRRLTPIATTEATEVARFIVQGIGKSGLWGEPNPESAYGTTSVSGSWSALIGRQVDSDLLTTFAAVQGLEAASELGIRQELHQVYNRMVHALVSAQSPVAEEYQRKLAEVDPQSGTAVLLTETTDGKARGWTVIGETMDSKGDPILRSGAATAAAVYCLVVARDRLSVADARYRRVLATINPSVEDGMTWLESHFDGARNPVDCGTGLINGFTGDHANLYCIALREAMLRQSNGNGASALLLGHRAWHVEVTKQLLPGLAAGGTASGLRTAFDTAMPVATPGNALWVVNDCLAALAAAAVDQSDLTRR
jgi:hypothetical protein